ncbi:hypothetical protein BABINDRAFT_145562 [Babjeviella inositovora NRRL Y-12698]|uniref:Secreted protein n=1 Tax=Babjeviella inositovora NRRL Y-12698 TaxID=984486 RepID=A0A1E3QPI6_9ASCO|nr:uncharacterized protein BABINDRAFT_145562 [Babjeviella inositovora NRRL Y-12698]ODQ79613.1 hypothetical protein BABINDRAFT_145562 [Babjeviella inositovora NRRL Y-12698]
MAHISFSMLSLFFFLPLTFALDVFRSLLAQYAHLTLTYSPQPKANVAHVAYFPIRSHGAYLWHCPGLIPTTHDFVHTSGTPRHIDNYICDCIKYHTIF